MRVKKTKREPKKNDSVFAIISKKSIKKDFNQNKRQIKEEPKREAQEQPKQYSERRVAQLSKTSSYAKFSRLIVGKRVKLIKQSTFDSNSWYVEFVFDEDRKALNYEADWTDNKKEYLLDGVKFK